jgi:hypothetical protein
LVNRASFRLPRTSVKGYDATAATAHPDCVAALNRIIEATDARMVSSSVWRMHGVVRMREILKTWGVRGTVIGCTPDLAHPAKGKVIIEAVERGTEIQQWLDNYHRTEIEAFAIIDDDSDMNGLSPYLIQTQVEPGLTLQDAERAIRLLNG